MPFADYVESVLAQTIKRLVVTRRSIRKAFEDLIITDESFNEIGPAINSAQSIFFFGYPGNGKTSIAERITRLMGDAIYIPHAVEANGQIIKVFDPIQHTRGGRRRPSNAGDRHGPQARAATTISGSSGSSGRPSSSAAN